MLGKKNDEKKNVISEEALKTVLESIKQKDTDGRVIQISDRTMDAAARMLESISKLGVEQTVELLEDRVGKAIPHTDGLGLAGKGIDTVGFGSDALLYALTERETRKMGDHIKNFIKTNNENLCLSPDGNEAFWEETTRRNEEYFRSLSDVGIAIVKSAGFDKASELTLRLVTAAYGVKEKKKEDEFLEESRLAKAKAAMGMSI